MDRHRGVSREDLKHAAVMAMTVLLVLGLLAAWNVLISGVMAWDDVLAAVIRSLRLTGPVAAAFAAWVAICRRRSGRRRGRLPTTWHALKGPLAILAVAVTAFGATVLVLTLRVGPGDQTGRLLPGGLALGAAGLALYVMIGWISGWALPAPITPPLAGCATFGLFALLADSAAWAGRLLPAAWEEPYDRVRGLDTVACADQTLWLAGISAALLLGWTAIVTRQALTLAALLIALVPAGAGLSRLIAEPKTVMASERVAYSCQEWPITVCVHPRMRSGLAELGSAFTTVAARLAGTPAAFQRVEQRSRGDDEQSPKRGITGQRATAQRAPGQGVIGQGAMGQGVVPIHLDDLDAGFAERATSEFVERLAEPCADATAAGYRAIVVAWLTDKPLPAGPISEHRYAAEWFSTLTDRERGEWLRMFYTDFTTCRLRSRHFGSGTQEIYPDRATYPVDPTPSPLPAHTPLTVSASAGLPGER